MQSTSFLADAMLGRLARWLRVIGADTLQLPVETPDPVLVQRASADARVLLTRDRQLIRELRPERAWIVPSEAPLEQLAAVVREFELPRPAELLTRCLLCNAPLLELERDAARPALPPSAWGLPGPVRHCPACGRVYWRGSHVRRMEAALAAALPGWR
ncbi:MAG TPA: Mut7-C RNAse domain-containing protein [Gemmatimonadaceae bacterium]